MRKFYPGITLFKLAGAILVLAAHALLIPSMTTMELPPLASFLMLEGRVVVPCFYIVSGFLLYKGWSHAANPGAYVRRYVLRILAVYAVFCLLFAFEFNVPALLQSGFGRSNMLLQAKILVMAVFVNGPLIQLWFIPPLLFGAIISYWMLSRFRLRPIVIGLAAAYLAIQLVSGSLLGVTEGWTMSGSGHGIDTIEGAGISDRADTVASEAARANTAEADDGLSASSSLFGYIVLWATRYIGFGLTFVAMGALFARYEKRLLRVNVRRLVVGAAILTVAELALLATFATWTDDYKLTFAILPNSLLLFYGVLRIRSVAMTVHHRILNVFSIVTFVAHIPFMRLNAWMFGWGSGSETAFGEQTLQTLLTFAECAALTMILHLRQKRSTAASVEDAKILPRTDAAADGRMASAAGSHR